MNKLEARYRKLLRLYPRVRRAVHGNDEMLAVLMAASREGQRWPTLSEVWDVFRGAMTTRLRGLTGRVISYRSESFASLQFPALVLLILGSTVPAVGLLVRALLNHYGFATVVLLALAATAWPAVLWLVLRRRRRPATRIAWMMGIAGLYLFGGGQMLEWGVLGIVAAISVTVSPGDRSAISAFGSGRSLVFAIGIVSLAPALGSQWARAGELHLPAWTGPPTNAATICGLLLISTTAFRFDTPAARRASTVLAWPLVSIALSLFQDGLFPLEPQELETFVSAALPVGFLILTLAVNWLAARRAPRPMTSGSITS